MKQDGFVLVEFVIALPLIILLLYSLGQMTFKIFSYAKNQSAEYILQKEAQFVLEQIISDAKAAKSVEIKKAVGNQDIQEIFFNYHVIGNEVNKKNYPLKNSSYNTFTTDIIDLIYTHRYTVAATTNHGFHIYAERQKNGSKTNPISGGNFFGDTSVTKLKFSQPSEKVLHIELEIQNLDTEKKFKVITSVFMPGCEKVVIKS